MEYADALRRNGWIPDPTDRVQAVAVHAVACASRAGDACSCQPRIVLAGATQPDAVQPPLRVTVRGEVA